MNALTDMKPHAIASLAMDRNHLVEVLGASLYPGAKKASIELVIGYCEAQQLDPMQKPVHIVPMLVKTGRLDQYNNDIKEWRDVVMPGVGLYRIQAARTGAYMGVSEPEFGPEVEMAYEEEYWENRQRKKRPATVQYPLWCKVTVKRLVAGVVAEFTALEYWRENYAEKGNGPNAMWAKRAYGQLAKCAEAQALRKAFPEVGAMPTAEEMEGRGMLDINDIPTVEDSPPAAADLTPQRKSAAAAAETVDATPAQPAQPEPPAAAAPAAGNQVIDGEFKEVPEPPAAAPAKAEQKPAAPAAGAAAAPAGALLSEGMCNTLLKKMGNTGKTEADFAAKFGFPITAATKPGINDYLAWAEK